MTNGTEKYIETVSYLGKLYEFINQNLFNGELLKPVITVQVDSRNKSFGWWSTQKVWKESKDDEGAHELNVCAQFLNRSRKTLPKQLFTRCVINMLRYTISKIVLVRENIITNFSNI